MCGGVRVQLVECMCVWGVGGGGAVPADPHEVCLCVGVCVGVCGGGGGGE